MFGRSSESKDFLVALIVTAGLVAAFIIYARIQPYSKQQPNAVAMLPERGYMSPAASATITPAAIAAVYECASPQGRVFSDRPCGPDAEVRTVQAPNGMQTQPANNTHDPPPHRESRAHTVASIRQEEVAPPSKSRCAAIESAIDSINARMRRGYRNGEHYRERLRELSEERWIARCRFIKR